MVQRFQPRAGSVHHEGPSLLSLRKLTTALVTAAASHARDPKESKEPTGNLAPNGVQEGAISGIHDKLEQDLPAARAAMRRTEAPKEASGSQGCRVAKAETLEVTGTIANTRPIAKT